MADGFLSRWAKRKEAVRQGKELPQEPQEDLAARSPSPQPSPAGGRGSAVAGLAPSPRREEVA